MKLLLKVFTVSSFLGLSFLSLADNNNQTKQTGKDIDAGNLYYTGRVAGNLCYPNKDELVCNNQADLAKRIFG